MECCRSALLADGPFEESLRRTLRRAQYDGKIEIVGIECCRSALIADGLFDGVVNQKLDQVPDPLCNDEGEELFHERKDVDEDRAAQAGGAFRKGGAGGNVL